MPPNYDHGLRDSFRSAAPDLLLCLDQSQSSGLEKISKLSDQFSWASIFRNIDVVIEGNTSDSVVVERNGIRISEAAEAANVMAKIRERSFTEPRDLLVMFSPAPVSSVELERLREIVRSDHMIGFAAPRIEVEQGRIQLISLSVENRDKSVRRAILDSVDSNYLLPQIYSPVFLVRADVLAAIEMPPEYLTIAACLRAFASDVRRCGFQTIVDNKTVIAIEPPSVTVPIRTEFGRVQSKYDCLLRVQERLDKHDSLRWESNDARRVVVGDASSPSILFDARNLSAVHNGTAANILGIFSGITGDRRALNAEFLISEEAYSFHKLGERFDDLSFTYVVGDRTFDVALRLSQCWSVNLWSELHGWGRAIGATILDSIGVDTVYLGPETDHCAFQFGASHADGLAFNSHYTKNLFERRFIVSKEVERCVFHHSFDLSDYRKVTDEVDGITSDRSSILVVGNAYRHKDMQNTLALLANAFPYRKIVSLGPATEVRPNIESYTSGNTDESVVAKLYANAKIVVFPSFYEGFGLPVLEGLANGAAVVCRSSPLLQELRDNLPTRVQLVPYWTALGLINSVSSLLREEQAAAVPSLSSSLQTDVAKDRNGWAAVTARLLDFSSTIAQKSSPTKWRNRDRLLRQMLASGLP